ncbi:MAG: glycosyltransferase 87 family protein [Thermoleophilaceae bacterium]
MLAALVLVVSAASGSTFLVPAGHSELPGWLSGPLPNLGLDLPRGAEVALIVVMGIAWAAVVAVGPSLRRPTVAAIIGLHIVLLLGPPLLSTDVFGYVAFGRLGAVHGLDPYSHAVDSIPLDPVNTYLSEVWPTDLKSPYGPLFLLATYAFVPFGIPVALWGLKLLATAAALGCIALVARSARRLRLDPVRSAAFVGLNPLWLIWVVGGAHNDLPMMLLALGGVALLVAGSERASGALFAGAIAVKATAGLIAIFALAGARRAGRLVLGGAAASLVLVGLFLAVFGFELFLYPGTLAQQGEHVSRYNVPRHLVYLLGGDEVTSAVKLVVAASFAAVTVGLLVAVRRGVDWITAAAWATIAFLVTSTSLHTWYVAALLPLVALSPSRRLRAATVATTALLLVVQLVPPD